MRSTFGRNLRNICLNASVDLLNIVQARNEIKYREIADINLWRVSMIKELTDYKTNNLHDMFTDVEVFKLINDLACA